jgi:hypothetical protein
MRRSLVSLGVAMVLAACGPATPPPNDIPSLEPRNEDAIRIYSGTTPRCGFREVGQVSGMNYRQLRSHAFRLRANAIILDPQRFGGGVGTSGMAVAFTRADCQQ